ncbi:MAG: flagellar biosynthetic protein FliP, partial [Pseudohongiellaceae bacterium]
MLRALTLLVALILVPDLAFAQSDLTLVTSQSNTSGGTDYSISLQILMLMTVLTLLPAGLMAMT